MVYKLLNKAVKSKLGRGFDLSLERLVPINKQLIKDLLEQYENPIANVLRKITGLSDDEFRDKGVYILKLLKCFLECDDGMFEKIFNDFENLLNGLQKDPDKIDERRSNPRSNPINEEYNEDSDFKLFDWILLFGQLSDVEIGHENFWEVVEGQGQSIFERAKKVYKEIRNELNNTSEPDNKDSIKNIVAGTGAGLFTVLLGPDPMLHLVKLQERGEGMPDGATQVEFFLENDKVTLVYKDGGGNELDKEVYQKIVEVVLPNPIGNGFLMQGSRGKGADENTAKKMKNLGYPIVRVGDGRNIKEKFMWEIILEQFVEGLKEEVEKGEEDKQERQKEGSSGESQKEEGNIANLSLWKRYVLFLDLYLLWNLYQGKKLNSKELQKVARNLNMGTPHRLMWFKSKGFKDEEIKEIMNEWPSIFSYGINDLNSKREWFKDRGFEDEEIKKIINKSPSTLGLSLDNLDEKWGWFRGNGFEDEEIKKIINKLPAVLGLSLDNLGKKWTQLGPSAKKEVLENPFVLIRAVN